MERSRLIERLIDEKGMSKRQFAEMVGVPPTTLQSILKRGVGNASIDNIIKVCSGLGISVDQLERMAASEVDYVAESSSAYVISKETTYKYLPVSISAGSPLDVDGMTNGDIEEITLPNSIMGKWAGSSDIYMMRVNGESMNNIIPHGSLIAIKEVDQSQLKDGDIVVFSENHDYSLKRFFDLDSQIIFRPDSNDKHFIDNVISKDNPNLKIHGKVVVYIVELD